MNSTRKKWPLVLLVLECLIILCVTLYGLLHPPVLYRARTAEAAEDRYQLNERTVADFGPTLVEKFREESRLVVSSVQAGTSFNLQQSGILPYGLNDKSQTLTYRGSAEFYVDLSVLGEQNIRLDSRRHVVVLCVPHTRLAPVEIDPTGIGIGDTQKGILAFGEMKFTPQEYNDLERELQARMTRAFDTEANRTAADDRAVEELVKLFQPVVRLIDDGYSVEIEFL